MDVSELRPREAEYGVFDVSQHTIFREKPDGATDPAGETGWFLQRERERLGLTLSEASEATGIHSYHLEAIEMGDLTHLPQRVDALNMVGYYAHYLGFDPEPLIHHYASILPKPQEAEPNAHPANPRPLSSALILKFGSFPKLPRFDMKFDSFPGGAGGAAASFLVAIAAFASLSWVLLDAGTRAPLMQTAQTDVQTPAAEVAAAPETVVYPPVQSEYPAVGSRAPAATAEASPVTEPQAPGQEPVDGITALIEQSMGTGGAAAPEATATIETPKDAKPAASLHGSRLKLKARGPVWVRIEDASGNVVMTQMLMAGDTYDVPNREGLVVIARDGGLLAYIIDGKEKGILGPPGEILVGRSLDIKSLEKSG
jgi:cytoskeleton protein RodZ